MKTHALPTRATRIPPFPTNVISPRKDITIAIDPSSTRAGYAIFDGEKLIQAGYITANSWAKKSSERIGIITHDIEKLLDEYSPETVVVEDVSAHVGSRHKGYGAGLAVYGKAVGAIWWACCQAAPVVALVLPETWTRGKPKAKRAAEQGLDASGDAGLDAADAVGLGRWFLTKRRIQRAAQHGLAAASGA